MEQAQQETKKKASSLLPEPEPKREKREKDIDFPSQYVQESIRAQLNSFSGKSSDIEKIKLIKRSLESYTVYLTEMMKTQEKGNDEGEEKACGECEDFSTSSEKHMRDHVEAHQTMSSMSDGGRQHIQRISLQNEQEGRGLLEEQKEGSKQYVSILKPKRASNAWSRGV